MPMSALQSTSIALSSFNFGATVKVQVSADGKTFLNPGITGVSSITLTSRDFSSYEECVSSCRGLMDDVLQRLNTTGPVFKLASEINPVHSGQGTLSRDWEPGEICRIWIYDKNMEKTGQISAIGQARVFGSTRVDVSHMS